MVATSLALGDRVTIPGGALAQSIRQPQRQVQLARLLRQPTTGDDLARLDPTLTLVRI